MCVCVCVCVCVFKLRLGISKFLSGKNSSLLFFFKLIYLIYLSLAAFGLHCCARAFSSCGERGRLFVAVCVLLIVVASLFAEHGL